MEFYPTNEYREVTLQTGLNSVQLGNTDKLFSDGLEKDEYIYFDDSKGFCDEHGWQWEDFYYDIEIKF